MVSLKLKLHGSNFNKDNDGFEEVVLLKDLREQDFNDNLYDSVVACLQCLTKGLYKLQTGFAEPLDTTNLKNETETTTGNKRKSDSKNSSSKHFKSDAVEDKNVDELINSCRDPKFVDKLVRLIRKNYHGLTDADDGSLLSIKKANNAYILQLFRLQVVYSQPNVSLEEFQLSDMTNSRFVHLANVSEMCIVSFENFKHFGKKLSIKMSKNNREVRNLDGAVMFWLPVVCNFKNKPPEKEEEGKPDLKKVTATVSNYAVSDQFNLSLVAQITNTRFCSTDEFIARLQKYDDVTSLVPNAAYSKSFLNLKESSKLYFPSIAFCKYSTGVAKEKLPPFTLPDFFEFSQDCWKIDKFFEYFGFVGEAAFLEKFPQFPPNVKPLDLKTLKELDTKRTDSNTDILDRFSRSVYEKLENNSSFNSNYMIQYTLLSDLAVDIKEHKERKPEHIEAFKEHVDKWDDLNLRPKDEVSYVNEYNELARKAREEGKF